jgi:hypothetical protein
MFIERAALAAILVLCLGNPVGATVLAYAQGGYADGATLQFTVTGNDTNGDGFLEFENVNPVDEISDFSLTFSGNALIAPFSLGANDLLVFYLNLTTLDFLDPDAIIFAGDNTVAYVAGGSAGADCIGVFLCGVVAAVDIDLATRPLTRIAEPSGLALLGLALPVMLALRRRNGEGAGPAQ